MHSYECMNSDTFTFIRYFYFSLERFTRRIHTLSTSYEQTSIFLNYITRNDGQGIIIHNCISKEHHTWGNIFLHKHGKAQREQYCPTA